MNSLPSGFPKGNRPEPHAASIAIFWKHVNKGGPVPAHRPDLGPCWVWTASLLHRGYGRWAYRVGGVRTHMGAHRFSAMIAGLDLGDLFICHHCDNPPCVNPAHLFVGTTQDNTADRMAKGREAKGTMVPTWLHAKILTVAIHEIREAHGHPDRIVSLAERYDMHPQAIRKIARGDAYEHIS